MMHVNGIAVGLQRQFDDVDGANDAGAKSAWAHAH
jgi:hypothetical protein